MLSLKARFISKLESINIDNNQMITILETCFYLKRVEQGVDAFAVTQASQP